MLSCRRILPILTDIQLSGKNLYLMNMLIAKDEESRWWDGNGVQGPVTI